VLSVVITTWNEEKNLPRVVASVRGLADEIVVVDTESTDHTRQVAKDLGCRVYTHKNTGIVEPVRNFSIAQAKGDWILLLDADEEVPPDLKKYILKIISDNSADYCRIPRRNYIFGRWIKSAHWWPDYVYRLFRKGFVVWDNAIHSIPQTRGTGFDFPSDEHHALIHHHYDDVSQYLDRVNRYTNHQLSILQAGEVSFHWRYLIQKPAAEFLSQYFSREGFREGIHGLALAGLQAFSELVLYLKLWQSQGFVDQKITLSEFGKQVQPVIKDYHWWLFEEMKNTQTLVLKPIIKIYRQFVLFLCKFLSWF
jgi:(heptosyl)LPS beta-1,4-glucosyltransferase